MKLDLSVDVRHLARVEGHGNILVRVKRGEIEEARWDVVETPRFFEVMLKGKHYTTAGILTARICGICSIGHCLASLRATEKAFGLTIPEAAAKLRLLAKHGETLQSHCLHLFFLAAPDFLGLDSALPLIQSRPEVVAIAARLKGLGNRICEAVAGRATHPVCLQVGGVTRLPDPARLRALRGELAGCLADLSEAADLFRSFSIPDFERETEYVSLEAEGAYPWIGGRLVSSDGVEKPERDYLGMTNEWVVEGSTSKWCRLSRDSFAVGALARFNNNHRLLRPEAAALADSLDLTPVCHNPFKHTLARLVECVHVVHESIDLVDEVLALPASAPLMAPVAPRAGEGVAAVEVPRGILYHHLVYDGDGRVERANCIIPTTQNNKNIHDDLDPLVRRYAAEEGMTDEKLELLCSMLVRAYDPCISCSVH